MIFTAKLTTSTGVSKAVEIENAWHFQAAEAVLRDHAKSGHGRSKWVVEPGKKISDTEWKFEAHAGKYLTAGCKWEHTATVTISEGKK